MKPYNIVDLFAGCGGLLDGFLQTGKYKEVASVEWMKPQVNTLIHRLETKWGVQDAKERVLHFDMQREEELFHGWENDEKYGSNKGLDHFVHEAGHIDMIIGGPPCQAYSVAGRVRDENNMKNDYRNYLFEHYLNVVKRYQPKMFVFENVPGMLSSMPDGTPITDLIREGFESIGYEIVEDMKQYALLNSSHFGVPQNRKRVILVGLNKSYYKNAQEILKNFYTNILPKQMVQTKMTLLDAIGDLPACEPIYDEESHKKKKSHHTPNCDITWHKPRYHNLRDMKIFRMLADDLQSGRCEYTDSKKLSELYEKEVGSKSPIHRYHVLRPDLPGTTIIAHLYKDGNRYIHFDPTQARTLTVREAARIQSFDDDFDFVGTQGHAYQMIGNAVPPKFAKAIGMAIHELMVTISEGEVVPS
ncbi:DNA (cytosine-5-)-methyltransferase [Bacillus sp. 31A1R]|uniref:Cytosine-specific methyltransferase n=1 Tax=Robertmurraya mangrovi TaxID=3098077 RepID=A0ABU5IZ29_9BACI|nr:DNA (cytosine-5-)-methyltransferase [Bacillus sp. 31A1R]MDZ5472423.1 DNA (cytosine-5-)-methyltransferase [Bacillus sp. 31A1R]